MDMAPAENRTGEPDFSAFVEERAEGIRAVTYMVDGVHCAACIQKIESALSKEPDISYVRLNFSTRRLNVEWKGLPDRANAFAAIVKDQGYPIHSFDPKAIQAESDEEERFLQMCLGVSGFASGNLMMLSFSLWSTTSEVMGVATRDLLHWVSAVIAIPSVAYAGQPYFRSAWNVLKKGKTNMDVPISLGILGACFVSLWQIFHHGEHAYFDSAVMLLFFLLIGKYLDFQARRKARSTASGLLAMMSGTAVIFENGQTRSIPIRDVREGMIALVAMGQRIPADAKVEGGESEIDTSLVTGETAPRSVGVGDVVYAGTLNLSAPLRLLVTAASKDSLLSDIVRLMEKAEHGQAKYVRIADRAARFYTPLVHALALATLLFWRMGMGADWSVSILIAVTVLIITCPCALGLAVPVVQVLASGRMMKKNILVKSGDAFERLSVVDTVIFDKTGTLTYGRPRLQNRDEIEDDLFILAASMAAQSHHPLSQALAKEAKGELVALGLVTEYPGQGLEAASEKGIIRLGRRAWCGEGAAPSFPDQQEIWLSVPERAPACFRFKDDLRADAARTVTQLKELGVKPVLLSGDRLAVVEDVARQLGIEQFEGDLTPIDKYNRMEALKGQGHKILMVGDGLNDAPTLIGANVSMSPSSAIDMAQNAADIVFMGEHLAPVAEAYKTAVFSQKLVVQNLVLAALYNIIAVPLAVAGLVTPSLAAIAMSSSSMIVIGNSFRLNRMR
jgi:Cu2+-exporting ATPase